MKILLTCISTLLIFQSCKTKKEQSKELKSFFNKCDELNILYYAKDTFVYKTNDTASINNFTGLIDEDNDTELQDSSQRLQEQLIYKSKGKTFFSASVFSYFDKKGILTQYVSYILQARKYIHLLTYQTGMGIDWIYEHKINPIGNPWPNMDTSKFHYEDIKNHR